MMALFRTEERPLAEQFALPQALFYWRSASGGEVDALAGEGAIRHRVPVEVKYQRNIDRRSLAPMRRAFGKGIVVTRDHLDLDDPALPFVPAAIFLWLLGGETVTSGAWITGSECGFRVRVRASGADHPTAWLHTQREQKRLESRLGHGFGAEGKPFQRPRFHLDCAGAIGLPDQG